MAYSPQVTALINKYGEERAFALVDRARVGGMRALSPEEQSDLQGLDLPRVDREIEGGIQGLSAIPASAVYEYLAKPAARHIGPFNSVLPTGFQYQEGVTSPTSFENVRAASRGAMAGGRVLPKEIEDYIRNLVGKR